MSRPNRTFLRIMWKLHHGWYRLSGGRIGAKIAGLPVLELTTTGRTSGLPRSVLLAYVDDPNGFVVIASNAGNEHDPAWWGNLVADPRATVRTGGVAHPVRMRRLEGEARERAWARAVSGYRGYAGYASKAGRPIPVALLEVQPGD